MSVGRERRLSRVERAYEQSPRILLNSAAAESTLKAPALKETCAIPMVCSCSSPDSACPQFRER